MDMTMLGVGLLAPVVQDVAVTQVLTAADSGMVAFQPAPDDPGPWGPWGPVILDRGGLGGGIAGGGAFVLDLEDWCGTVPKVIIPPPPPPPNPFEDVGAGLNLFMG